MSTSDQVTSDTTISPSGPSNSSDHAEAWHVKPSAVLPGQILKSLNERSDLKGWRQLAAHLTVMAVSGALWGFASSLGGDWAGMQWGLAIPALVVYGFSLASMFAAVHECIHRTAFANQRLNDAVAWFAGLLSFYNSTFYRRYHKWHHRYTQIPGKDPELEEPTPTTWGGYLMQISGLPWWGGKLRGYAQMALGKFEGCPYISDSARAEVVRSAWLQLAVYAGAIGISVAVGQPWFITYWLLPLAVGQPILRFILLAEHRGCTQDDNPLTNTRTTLTLWPIRLLMWNMPFHTEHHLYASIPFHALPAAHEQLADRLGRVAPGYVAANREITAGFGGAA